MFPDLTSQLKQFDLSDAFVQLPLNAPRMHADLQGKPMALAVALTVCHSSKASSLMAGPTSACLLTSCRNNGMNSSICTWATFSSGPAASARSGGHVISAQMAFLISGRLLFSTGSMEGAVLSAQAKPFVSTTRLPGRHRKLHCSGMPKKSCNISRPSDRLQQHEGPLEVQRLLARMAGSSLG